MNKNIQAIVSTLKLDEWELKNVDSEDIGDVLVKVEKSFGFEFADDELKDVKTFGELCDIINAKVQGRECNDCSTQQAFYKFREAIAKATLVDRHNITLDAELQMLFPKPDRKRAIKFTETQLGFKLNLLKSKNWIVFTLVLLFLTSFVYLFINWKIGVGGFLLFTLFNRIATVTVNEIGAQTMRELVSKSMREHYRKVRRQPGTINRKEITEQVTMLFAEGLALERSSLHREAAFSWA